MTGSPRTDLGVQNEWEPLGLRRTIAFLLRPETGVASWRHLGWELEVEKLLSRRFPTSVCLWNREML